MPTLIASTIPIVVTLLLLAASVCASDAPDAAYLDTKLPFEARAKDLVSRMTLEEKVSQMVNDAPAIERLGVPHYDWWNECLHGVARAGVATVFPQAIGLAATWNQELVHTVATTISDEARAKHHEAIRQGDRGIYKGLTFWTPNINIFRDPRWGRGQETYGEDPYLTGRMGVAFVKGLQGDDPKYLKVVATPKHYAVHSGPERDRHSFDARVSLKDLRETYLPAFRDCVVEAKADSVMGAYNRTNGEACCASKTLLEDILRKEWGFEGYVVSDCGAIDDIHQGHKLTKGPSESAALAVKAGCDLCCARTYYALTQAVKNGLISETEVDTAVERLFVARFRLGMFDPPEMVRYAKIPYEINDSEEHRQLALEAARQSIVLLKNQDGMLPLNKSVKAIAVIGPGADSLDVLLANYCGTPSRYVTPLAGIRNKVGSGTNVTYAKGCEVTREIEGGIVEAVAAAGKADVTIMCLGLSPQFEGEEGAPDSEANGDRIRIELPAVQQRLLEQVCATGKPVVLVLVGGSAIAVSWAQEHVPAILDAWYPGEEGGTAVADVLFGDYSPAGRLPVTFVKSVEQLPPFSDYSMKGRTYRYLRQEPLYPFGFGLSYTAFKYSGLAVGRNVKAGESLEVRATVENTGKHAGDEVVQIYVSRPNAGLDAPIRQLMGFKRVHLAPGEKKEVAFKLTPKQMALIDDEGRRVLEPGKMRITVGGSQGDERSLALGASAVVKDEVEITGSRAVLEY